MAGYQIAAPPRQGRYEAAVSLGVYAAQQTLGRWYRQAHEVEPYRPPPTMSPTRRYSTRPPKRARVSGPGGKLNPVAYIRKPVMVREVKNNDSVLAVVDNLAQIIPVNLISQGDSGSTRDGRTIQGVGLSICGAFQSPDGTNETHTVTGRIIIVVDKTPDGVANILLADVLEGASPGVNSLPDMSEMSRYAILTDRFYSLQPWGGLGTARTQVHFRIPIKQQTFYSGNAGTVADLRRNTVYAIFLSNVLCDMTFNIRYTFTDEC